MLSARHPVSERLTFMQTSVLTVVRELVQFYREDPLLLQEQRFAALVLQRRQKQTHTAPHRAATTVTHFDPEVNDGTYEYRMTRGGLS